nr:MAG TPA: hypothetical protein [Caudoviricetes sp.]
MLAATSTTAVTPGLVTSTATMPRPTRTGTAARVFLYAEPIKYLHTTPPPSRRPRPEKGVPCHSAKIRHSGGS